MVIFRRVHRNSICPQEAACRTHRQVLLWRHGGGDGHSAHSHRRLRRGPRRALPELGFSNNQPALGRHPRRDMVGVGGHHLHRRHFALRECAHWRALGGLPQRVCQGQLVHAHRQPRGGQPGRRAQHRARVVWPGRVCLCGGYGQKHSIGLAHAIDHDAAGHHRLHQGSAVCRAYQFSRSLLECGSHPLANHPPDCAAQFDQRHSNRGHSASQPHGRRNRASHADRGGHVQVD